MLKMMSEEIVELILQTFILADTLAEKGCTVFCNTLLKSARAGEGNAARDMWSSNTRLQIMA